MRSVFTVEIPSVSADKYPTDDEFLARIRTFGWEDVKTRDLPPDDKQLRYKEQAEHLWVNMPEIATEEKDYVIFYGNLADNQTKFIITRRVDGQATFRLLHPNLSRLQSSTTAMIKRLIEQHGNVPILKISNQRVTIFERGYDDIIIRGRVIQSALRESWKTDRKNALLTIGALSLAIISFIALQFIDPQAHRTIGGTLERASTAFLTTTIVSAIGFLQTYLEIRGVKIIDWTVASDEYTHP